MERWRLLASRTLHLRPAAGFELARAAFHLGNEPAGPLLELEPVEAVNHPTFFMKRSVACSIRRRHARQQVVRAVNLDAVEDLRKRNVDFGNDDAATIHR